jgi:RNA polymerase sigma-70 factor (ECF subfamily)
MMAPSLDQELFPRLGPRATPAGTMRDEAAALMERYCDGDASAFRALYALAAPRLLGYLVCLTRDRVLAEELLQQTFIKLHNARASYLRGADPLPWLYTIAHRVCLDELRRTKRSRVKLVRGDAQLPEPAATLQGAAEGNERPYDDETIADVLEALEKLPEIHRVAVVLTKIQGKSTAEAAEILGTTAAAVKLRAHRGYVMLREMLREEEGEP